MNHPVKGVQEAKHPKIFTKLRCQNYGIPKTTSEIKLADTHTQERIFPPIMVAIAESNLF